MAEHVQKKDHKASQGSESLDAHSGSYNNPLKNNLPRDRSHQRKDLPLHTSPPQECHPENQALNTLAFRRYPNSYPNHMSQELWIAYIAKCPWSLSTWLTREPTTTSYLALTSMPHRPVFHTKCSQHAPALLQHAHGSHNYLQSSVGCDLSNPIYYSPSPPSQYTHTLCFSHISHPSPSSTQILFYLSSCTWNILCILQIPRH